VPMPQHARRRGLPPVLGASARPTSVCCARACEAFVEMGRLRDDLLCMCMWLSAVGNSLLQALHAMLALVLLHARSKSALSFM
jgi:hypothetical protein